MIRDDRKLPFDKNCLEAADLLMWYSNRNLKKKSELKKKKKQRKGYAEK